MRDAPSFFDAPQSSFIFESLNHGWVSGTTRGTGHNTISARSERGAPAGFRFCPLQLRVPSAAFPLALTQGAKPKIPFPELSRIAAGRFCGWVRLWRRAPD
jgi:hypothetical protein